MGRMRPELADHGIFRRIGCVGIEIEKVVIADAVFESRPVAMFHTVCTRHPETIHASGKARRSNSSDIAALTGLRHAPAGEFGLVHRQSCRVGKSERARRSLSNEDGGYGAKRALPPYGSIDLIACFEASARHCRRSNGSTVARFVFDRRISTIG